MFHWLLSFHSIIRWLLLVMLLIAIIRAVRGYKWRLPYTKAENSIRHWTATMAHIQLVVGMMVYLKSPLTKYFWQHINEAASILDSLFFPVIHLLLMLSAITILTIGSALTKRRFSDHMKFRTQLVWFAAALLLILIAIPWPCSPLAQRPYFR